MFKLFTKPTFEDLKIKFQINNLHSLHQNYNQAFKQQYPFRYIIHTVMNAVIFQPIDNFKLTIQQWSYSVYNFIKYNTWCKMHYLDLRQKNFTKELSFYNYKYGYLSAQFQLEYAVMNIFINFYESNNISDKIIAASKDQKDPHEWVQNKVRLEMKEIYDWWTVTRIQELLVVEKKRQEWLELDNQQLLKSSSTKMNELFLLESKLERKIDSYLIRVLEIKNHLYNH